MSVDADAGPAGPARARLRQLLRSGGILWSSGSEVIRGRDGTPAPWAFYSWGVSLTAEGLRLSAACLLDKLATFELTQLASIGYTGLPLLAACVLLGEGRYSGLCVRDRRKAYLSGRQIEGNFDRSRPVVILDDSLSSGTSLLKAIRAIEGAGGTVEGAIALTLFPGRGGLEWANGAGYRTEVIFDVWSDLGMAATVPGPPPPLAVVWSGTSTPDGLHPASLARLTARQWLETGTAPIPPKTLDADYDPTGGVFVSFRTRNDDIRLARDGFWHFPGEPSAAPADVVRATVETLVRSGGAIDARRLDRLKIAVSFFSPLELTGASGLDFSRYGIVVRSRRFPAKTGGALANTQVFISEIEQLRHASRVNARVDASEPFDLFRHTLHKCVEPGTDWLSYGQEDREAGARRDPGLGRRLIREARAELSKALRGERAEGSRVTDLGFAIGGVAVRLYRDGLRGYGIGVGADFGRALTDAVAALTRDPRLNAIGAALDSGVLVVSVLHNPERLGFAPLEKVAEKLRRGLDALEIENAAGRSVLLPSALTYNSWSRRAFVEAAARIAGGVGRWTTWQVAEWLEVGDEAASLQFGFPDRSEADCDGRTSLDLLAGYIDRSLDENGLPCYWLDPMNGSVERSGTAARVIHALIMLDAAGRRSGRSDWRKHARQGLGFCLGHAESGSLHVPGLLGGAMAECLLVAGIAPFPELAASPAGDRLARKAQSLFQPDGRIALGAKSLDAVDDHDFLPGVALWALATFASETGRDLLPANLARFADFYRYRFRAVPHWGGAGWLPQAWAAVRRVRETTVGRDLAFLVSDWAIERQLEVNGAFLETFSPDEPSFNTGFIAEGVAASWALARQAGEAVRAERYERSWRKSARFMNRLLIRPEDTFGMSVGAAAIGGVRCTLTRSDVRIDQVSHWLHALLSGDAIAG